MTPTHFAIMTFYPANPYDPVHRRGLGRGKIMAGCTYHGSRKKTSIVDILLRWQSSALSQPTPTLEPGLAYSTLVARDVELRA